MNGEELLIQMKSIFGWRDDSGKKEFFKTALEVVKFATTALGIVTGAIMVFRSVTHLELPPIDILTLGLLPAYPAVIYFIALYSISRTDSTLAETIRKLDRAVFEIYKHVREIGKISRHEISRIASRHSLSPHYMKHLDEKSIRIEYLLVDNFPNSKD